MKKLLLSIFCSIQVLQLLAQVNNWQPTAVYAVDKTVINTLKVSNQNPTSGQLTNEQFANLQNQIYQKINEAIPSYLQLETIKSISNINFTGVSTSAIKANFQSITVPLQSYQYKIYLEKTAIQQSKEIEKFKSKLIGLVNQSNLTDVAKGEVKTKIESVKNSAFFFTWKKEANAIDLLNPELNQFLSAKVGVQWQTIKSSLTTDANKIIEISNVVLDDFSTVLNSEVKAIENIKYFTSAIQQNKATYEQIKNSNPVEAFKLLQKNDLFLQIIESTNLKDVNDFANEAVSVLSDANQVKNILSSNDNYLQKTVSTLTVLQKSIKTLFPESSDEFAKSMDALSNTQYRAEIKYYSTVISTVGDLALNSGLIHMSKDVKKGVNFLINAGVAVASFYTGNFVTGISSVVGIIGGLFGGGGDEQDAMSQMISELNKNMIEGFKHMDDRFNIIDQKLDNLARQNQYYDSLIIAGIVNISEQLTQMDKKLNAIAEQNRYYDSLILSGISSVSGQISDMNDNIIKIHEENILRLNIVDEKLNLISQQVGCISATVGELATSDILTCRGATTNLITDNPITLKEFAQSYQQTCFTGLSRFANMQNVGSNFIDYTNCTDNIQGMDARLNPSNIYGELRRRWNLNFNTTEANLALINPTISVQDDILLNRDIRRASTIVFKTGNFTNYKNLFDNSEDKLNNVQIVLDMSKWYLQYLPFKAVVDNNGSIKNETDWGKNLSVTQIQRELQLFNSILQITIAQQSLMSGTMMLNQFQTILMTGNIKDRNDVLSLMNRNAILGINMAKFILSSNTLQPKDGEDIYLDNKIVIFKANKSNGKSFFILIPNATNGIDNLISIYNGNKSYFKQGNTSELQKLGSLFVIDDPKTLEFLGDQNRVLPPGFFTLLELHKTFTNIIAEIQSLKSLSPQDLQKLKPIYLN